MGKDKILIYEDERADYEKLAQELKKTSLYDVIPSIDPDGKYPYEELEKSFDEDTSFDYVSRIIQENWDDGLKIIICDLLVNEKNLGKELIEKIRCNKNFLVNECMPFSAIIPIIAYTHSIPRKDIDKALKSGASDFVQKPIDTSDPRMEEENERRMEDLKEIIKQQIDFFDKKLDLIEDKVPIFIKEEVRNFKAKNRGKTTAFIMTPFSDKHRKIIEFIKEILGKKGIIGYVADAPGGECHDNLLPNIQAFLHGCDFGIGIYDDISKLFSLDLIINSNLSLEVGYMFGLQKKVFLLKDKSLPKLNSDIDEKLYIPFDMDNLDNVEKNLVTWLKNKGFIGN